MILKEQRSFTPSCLDVKLQDMQGMDYTMIDTYGTPGGMYKRMTSDQQIMDHFGVPSVDEYSAKVEKLGGKIIVPKKAVPGWGYFVVCMDTENNVFSIFETDFAAK